MLSNVSSLISPNERSDGGQLMGVQIDTAALDSAHHNELQDSDLRTPWQTLVSTTHDPGKTYVMIKPTARQTI